MRTFVSPIAARSLSVVGVIVTCAVVLVTSATPAGAARARPAGLASPAIHETFTVLPCKGTPGHRSTLEQEGCAEHQILGGDKHIDALNKAIFARLTGDAAKRRFTSGHRAWLAYRRAYCLSRSDAAQGGTEAAVINATCFAAVNRQHIENLRGFLSALSPK